MFCITLEHQRSGNPEGGQESDGMEICLLPPELQPHEPKTGPSVTSAIPGPLASIPAKTQKMTFRH